MPRSGRIIRASTTTDCIFDPGSRFPGRHYHVRQLWAVLRGMFPFLRPVSPLNQQFL
ncbi:hypothetical protein M405DRAFT_818960 [Rhizopogon salebrosus TDB-379]|nr:hypothetical protein M405DRAFT_818959 [Rhizopogon salebrosus TDB-379]KAJ8588899.1 hypothetical protein M405DRAFT_818960 [Rhizopogon salebrosus TDB-379]